MTNRRQFLQIGIAASSMPIAGNLFADTLTATPLATPFNAIPLHKVVFDAEHAHGIAFGAAAARLGLSSYAMQRGDITDFWYNELDLAWRKEPYAIAGFTRHGPLFVLERFAWDRGLKVVFRAEHKAAGAGAIEHRLEGPAVSLSGASALAAAGGQWSSLMAGMVTQCAAGCSDVVEQTLISRTDEELPADERFYSWVIAPRA